MANYIINRANTNERLLNAASRELRGEETVKLFAEQYETNKKKLMAHIIRQIDEEPEKSCTLKPNVPFPWLNPIRKTGQPRLNWALETMRAMWKEAHEPGKALADEPWTELDDSRRDQIQTINLLVHFREVGN